RRDGADRAWRRAGDGGAVSARAAMETAARVLPLALLFTLATVPRAEAHDARPAYLQIDETAPGRHRVLWRIPVPSGMPLPVGLVLPDSLHDVRPPALQRLSDSLVERRVVE